MLLAVVLSFLFQSAPLSLDGLSEKQITATKAAITSLHSLVNKMDIGITLSEYRKQLANTKDVTDAATASLPDGALKKQIADVIESHKQVLYFMSDKFPVMSNHLSAADLEELRKDWPGFEPSKPGYLLRDDAIKYFVERAKKATKELDALNVEK